MEPVNTTNIQEAPEGAEYYKQILSLTKEMNDYLDYLRKGLSDIVSSEFYLNPAIIQYILIYSKEDIENKDINELREFAKEYHASDVNNKIDYMTVEESVVRENLRKVKDVSIMITSAEKQSDEIKKEILDVMNEYMSYYSSKTVDDARDNRLENLKAMNELETDIIKKRQNSRRIKDLEDSKSFEFLFDLFKEGAKEDQVNIFTKSFIDSKKSAYVLTRYNNKITKYGYKQDLYRHFMNLEETFLDEKYHVFNNLFLFAYMRYVGYSDPYSEGDTLKVMSLTSAIANLFYHNFKDGTEEENKFKDVIIRFLDMFESEYDTFEELNTTYKNNPTRIKFEEDMERTKKDYILHLLKKFKIEGYDESKNSDELKEFFDEKIAELKKKQNDETVDTGDFEDTDAITSNKSYINKNIIEKAEDLKTKLDDKVKEKQEEEYNTI